MSKLPTPNPHTTTENQPFWDAAADGRLVLPQCRSCGEVIWYPRTFCPSCASRDVEWNEISGTGTVYSFTVVERGQGRWRDHSPYVLAYVELAEGPRVLTNIYGDAEAVAIGSAVTARFDVSDEGGAILRFDLD